MGGGNAQKSAAAREKNQKQAGRSKEEREASKAKLEKDRNATKCLVCLQTFMVGAKPSLLYTHVTAKHAAIIKTPEKCFPCLQGFDPNAPEPVAAAPVVVKKKKKMKVKEEDLSDLLSAGLKGVGKKKK